MKKLLIVPIVAALLFIGAPTITPSTLSIVPTEAEAGTYLACKYNTSYKTYKIVRADGSVYYYTKAIRNKICSYKNQPLPDHAY